MCTICFQDKLLILKRVQVIQGILQYEYVYLYSISNELQFPVDCDCVYKLIH